MLATINDRFEDHLKWWGERELHIVAFAVATQITVLGVMGLVMLLNQWAFS